MSRTQSERRRWYLRAMSFVVAAALCAETGSARPSSRAAEPSKVYRHITLIDVAAPSPDTARKVDQAIITRAGRFVWIGPDKEAVLPAGADVVDASGLFALPAFWDMHVHIAGPLAQQRATLLMLLANGVVNVRDMGNDSNAEDFGRLRDALERGRVAGPRIVSSPMRITDGPLAYVAEPGGTDVDAQLFHPGNAEEVRRLVRHVASRKIDFIKPYDRLSAEVFETLMQEAGRARLTVGGHVPLAVSVEKAANAGMRSIEHARSLAWDCSPEGEELRRAYDLGTRGEGPPPEGAKLQNNPAFLRRVITGFDARRCSRTLEAMKRNGTYYVPTHMTRRMDAFASLPEMRTHPDLRYIEAQVQAWWAEDADFYSRRPAEDRAAFMLFHAHGLMLTRLAHHAGVNILVGTDTPDTFVFPGSSFHQEMQELADAGMPPLAVLRSATSLAAQFAGAADDRGLLKVGQQADMVILERDPLVSIENSRDPWMVVKGGVAHDRARLAGLRAEAAAAALMGGKAR